MKKFTLPVMFLAFVLFFSCKKSNPEAITDTPQNVIDTTQKYLKSITKPNSGTTIIETYTYDSQNRVIQEKIQYNSNSYLYDYTYISPTLIVKNDKQNATFDSLFLDNKEGLAVKQLRYYKNSALPDKYVYEYDSEKRLTKETYFSGYTGDYKLKGTYNFTYVGSKLMKTSEVSTILVNNEEREFTHNVTYEYAKNIKNTTGNKRKGMLFYGLESDFLPTSEAIEHIDKLISTGETSRRVTTDNFDYKLDKDNYVIQKLIKKINGFDINAVYEYF
jgi:hypothetical protein